MQHDAAAGVPTFAAFKGMP